MRSRALLTVVDSHTEGMPTRVLTAGVPPLVGTTMREKQADFAAHHDAARRLLMREPRGHRSMAGAVLTAPCDPEADFGLLFIEVWGFLPMCGHATIGAATVMVETGLVPAVEPETEVVFDTPAGLVRTVVTVRDGRAVSVRLRNVPSFVLEPGVTLAVDGLGDVTYDLAYGGNWYVVLDAADVGLRVVPEQAPELLRAGMKIMRAVQALGHPAHPALGDVGPVAHVELVERTEDGGRNAVAIDPGWLDRSPCGTGTSARVAQLAARGELGVGDTFVQRSLLDRTFTATIVAEAEAGGVPAIVPEVEGSAWISGLGQLVLDPTDPFPEGFLLDEG
ncbi:MAG TPA: proline racemase family protein [Solirubrobacteraceae bacterium]|nr:proline racemase family protein [Solirubrobacteraceae bacterium]